MKSILVKGFHLNFVANVKRILETVTHLNFDILFLLPDLALIGETKLTFPLFGYILSYQ